MGIKKLLALLLLVFLCIASISSCKIKGKGDSLDKSDSSNSVTENFIWAKGATLGIVTESGIEWGANDFLGSVYELTGSIPEFVGENSEALKHEFVFGNTSRKISQSAYRRLERELTGAVGEIGWLIYSDGSSVGIAFNSPYAMKFALDYINENFMTQKTLVLSAGTVASDVVMIDSYAEKYRNEAREEHFLKLEEQIGKEITDEIRKLFALYSDDIYVWLANLYDPETGGFYYSNSGRDNMGYLPDIESTVQALSHLTTGGMFAERGGSYATALPETIKEQLLSFAMGLQSPVDGFFYHPQWGENIIAARRGRDLGWATQLIQGLGGKPLYNTPGGVKGSLGAPSGIESVSSLTGRLSGSSVISVSKVLAASSTLPAYLQSLDAWAIYIDSLNLPNDSYVAGNTLAAQHNEIKAAGQEYIDYLIDYLNATQIPDLGLWEEIKPGKDTDCDPEDRLNYANVNGLMKIASVYNYYNVPVPNLENALRSCIKVALYPNDEGDAHVCCTYNPWVIMSIVLNGAEKSEGEARRDELRAIILESAPALISATVDKLIPHVRQDGCFSYFEKTLSHASQKALVACATTVESDVNATCICSTGIMSNMCSALGIGRIPLYYDPDCEYFLALMNNLGKIEKNPAEPVETVTFDDASAEKEYGVVEEPDFSMSVKVPDKTLDGATYKYAAADIVDDPIPLKKGDKALKINNYVYKKADGTNDLATSAMGLYTSITNSYIVGNTFSFEADYLVSKADNGYFMQMFITRSVEDPSHSFSLNFNTYTKGDKQYIKISDNYDGPDGERDNNLVSDIPVGEWFNFRVEMYKIYHELEDGATGKTLDIIAKLFVNGEYVGTSESSYTSSTNPTVVSEKGVGAIILSMYRFNNSEVYFDNVRAEKHATVYEETILPPEPAPEFVAAPAGERGEGAYYNKLVAGEINGKVHDYSNGGKKPSLSNGIEGNTFIAGMDAEEAARDAYLFFYRTGNTTHEAVTYKFKSGTQPENAENLVSIVEMDLAFGNMTKNLPVMIRIHSGGVRQSVYLTMSGENIVFDFTAEASRMKPIEQNKWVNITLETYVIDKDQPIGSDNVQTKAYVNGEFMADLSGVDVTTTSSEQIDVQLQYTNADSWLCVDNVYLGYIDKEFVASKEPVPENMPTITGDNWGKGAYYNGEYAGNRYDYDGKVAKPAITGGSSISKTYISDDVKRAIYFYKSIPEGAANGQATIPYYFSSTVPTGTKAVIFEADVAFSGFSNYTGTKAPNLQFNFVKDGWLAGFFIGADENGKIFTQFGKVVSGTNISLEENTWYNLRFEVYMGNANTKSVAKVYVDGEYVCDLNPGDDKATNSAAKSVSIVLRQFETDDWFVYDNVYLGYSSTAYVAPEGTTPGGSGGTGDSGDDGGDEPAVPDVPTVTPPTITGEKGQGVYYNGESAGKRIDTATLSVPDFGSIATAAIINKDFFYTTKNVRSGTANAQTNLPKAYFGTKPESAVGYVVEFDIALGNLSHTNVQFDIGIGGLYGSLYLYAGTPDAAVTTNFSNITAGEKIALEQNKWYNIRIVAYDIDGLVTFKLYVDGAYSCDIPSADKNKTAPNDYFIITLRQFDDDNWIAYDNLYLGYTDEAYIYGDPDSYVETPEGITGEANKGRGEYYNSEAAGTRLDGTSAGSINTAEIGDDATLELTKNGEILFKKNVTDTQSKSYIRINLPTAPTGALASVVEFDMVMATTMSEKYAGLVFMMEFLGYRGDIFIKGNGETYGSGHPSNVQSGSNISVKQGEWHNIRIVTYTVDSVMTFKVYVDGVYAMDINTANGTKTSSAKRFTLYMQEYDEGNDDYILIDNIYLGYTDIAYALGAEN